MQDGPIAQVFDGVVGTVVAAPTLDTLEKPAAVEIIYRKNARQAAALSRNSSRPNTAHAGGAIGVLTAIRVAALTGNGLIPNAARIKPQTAIRHTTRQSGFDGTSGSSQVSNIVESAWLISISRAKARGGRIREAGRRVRHADAGEPAGQTDPHAPRQLLPVQAKRFRTLRILERPARCERNLPINGSVGQPFVVTGPARRRLPNLAIRRAAWSTLAGVFSRPWPGARISRVVGVHSSGQCSRIKLRTARDAPRQSMCEGKRGPRGGSSSSARHPAEATDRALVDETGKSRAGDPSIAVSAELVVPELLPEPANRTSGDGIARVEKLRWRKRERRKLSLRFLLGGQKRSGLADGGTAHGIEPVGAAARIAARVGGHFVRVFDSDPAGPV